MATTLTALMPPIAMNPIAFTTLIETRPIAFQALPLLATKKMSALVCYQGAHWPLIWMCLPHCLLHYMSHCTPLGCVHVQQHIQEQVFGL